MRIPKRQRAKSKQSSGLSVTAGTWLTFRAELMPGREGSQRIFEVTRVLRSGRVELASLDGEHSLAEFENLSKPEDRDLSRAADQAS
jgi:hypothetical protein